MASRLSSRTRTHAPTVIVQDRAVLRKTYYRQIAQPSVKLSFRWIGLAGCGVEQGWTG